MGAHPLASQGAVALLHRLQDAEVRRQRGRRVLVAAQVFVGQGVVDGPEDVDQLRQRFVAQAAVEQGVKGAIFVCGGSAARNIGLDRKSVV